MSFQTKAETKERSLHQESGEPMPGVEGSIWPRPPVVGVVDITIRKARPSTAATEVQRTPPVRVVHGLSAGDPRVADVVPDQVAFVVISAPVFLVIWTVVRKLAVGGFCKDT